MAGWFSRGNSSLGAAPSEQDQQKKEQEEEAQKQQEQRKERLASGAASPQDVFESIDTSKDGELSIEEMETYLEENEDLAFHIYLTVRAMIRSSKFGTEKKITLEEFKEEFNMRAGEPRQRLMEWLEERGQDRSSPMLLPGSKEEFERSIQSNDFRGADLSRCDLSYQNLSGVIFTGANLSGANLYGSWLHGTDLRNADLSHADMRHSKGEGMSMAGANIFGARLSRAKLLPLERGKQGGRETLKKGACLAGVFMGQNKYATPIALKNGHINADGVLLDAMEQEVRGPGEYDQPLRYRWKTKDKKLRSAGDKFGAKGQILDRYGNPKEYMQGKYKGNYIYGEPSWNDKCEAAMIEVCNLFDFIDVNCNHKVTLEELNNFVKQNNESQATVDEVVALLQKERKEQQSPTTASLSAQAEDSLEVRLASLATRDQAHTATHVPRRPSSHLACADCFHTHGPLAPRLVFAGCAA